VRTLGLISLYVSCVSALLVLFYGAGRTISRPGAARRANLLSILAAALSTLALVFCFLADDFRLAYVARNSARSLPLIYKISALWAGQSGSLLLWLLILSLFSLAVQCSRNLREKLFDLRINAIMNGVRVLFMILLLFATSPFELLPDPPYSGAGLNPMLQSLGMVVHPPLLFAGFSGFLVPFAMAAAQLWQGDGSGSWLETARPWALLAWSFLTSGIVSGGQWAYNELGWGGYWAWDPVENASLFPWLTGTALVHTLALGKRYPGMKRWSYALATLTFALTIFGTFLTRSGVLDSVHAFSGGMLGPIFLAVLSAILVLAAVLAWLRRDCLKEDRTVGDSSLISLGSAAKVGNILLLLIFAAVFTATMFPLISRVLTGREVALGAEFFNQTSVPLFLAVFFLMSLAPVLARGRLGFAALLTKTSLQLVLACLAGLWGLKSGGGAGAALAFAVAAFGLTAHLAALGKVRRGGLKLGSIVVHMGVLLMLIGVTGSSVYTDDLFISVEPGDEFAFAGYTLGYSGLTARYAADRYTVGTTLSLARGGREAGELTSEKTFWENRTQPSTKVGVFSNSKEDLYLNLAGWQGQTAQLHLQRFALVIWIWIGSWVIYLGAVLALLDKQVRAWQKKIP
jgi:cytochrome c-type biogenesis protein CcmF